MEHLKMQQTVKDTLTMAADVARKARVPHPFVLGASSQKMFDMGKETAAKEIEACIIGGRFTLPR